MDDRDEISRILSELGKVNIGLEVANQVALALGMKLSDLVAKAE